MRVQRTWVHKKYCGRKDRLRTEQCPSDVRGGWQKSDPKPKLIVNRSITVVNNIQTLNSMSSMNKIIWPWIKESVSNIMFQTSLEANLMKKWYKSLLENNIILTQIMSSDFVFIYSNSCRVGANIEKGHHFGFQSTL